MHSGFDGENRDVFCTITRSGHSERMGVIITPLPNHLPHVAPLVFDSMSAESLANFRCFFPFQNHNRWQQSGEVNAQLSHNMALVLWR